MKHPHLHWEIGAYEKQVPMGTNGNYEMIDSCLVNVEAQNEKEALEEAKQIIKRNHYRVMKVVKACSMNDEKMEMQMLQLEIQQKMLKRMR